jgi:hypothetical protein
MHMPKLSHSMMKIREQLPQCAWRCSSWCRPAMLSAPAVCVSHLWLDHPVHLLSIPQVHTQALERALAQRHTCIVILINLDKQLNALQLLQSPLQSKQNCALGVLEDRRHAGHSHCCCWVKGNRLAGSRLRWRPCYQQEAARLQY